MLTQLRQDLMFTWRQLRRAPAFALLAVGTMALAIGATTALFSVVDATVIRPLPYRDPASIAWLRTYSPQGYTQPASWGQYVDWRKQNHTFTALAGFEGGVANLQAGNESAPVQSIQGTDSFFDVLGVAPLLGRTFAAGEDAPGSPNVLVLGYDLWQSRLGGRPGVIGSTLNVDGEPSTVIGVMPAGFRFPLSTTEALYRPIRLSKSRREQRGSHFLPVFGRLKPGVTLAAAQADMQSVFDNVGRAYPDEANRRVKMESLSAYLLGKTGGPLLMLSVAVLGVLLIGCINVAGLLLARGLRRQREWSLRAAVGASRGRLARQLLTESAVIAVAGGVGGVALSATLLQLLRQLLIASLQRGADVSLNGTVLLVSLLIALGSGLLAGVLPALQTMRVAPALNLRAGVAAGSSRRQGQLRGGFVVGQVAITLGLLVCSALLLRNLQGLRSADLGLRADGLYAEPVFLNASSSADHSLVSSFYAPLLDRVRALPGVTGAGVINLLPVQDYGSNGDIAIVGKPPAPKDQEQLAEMRYVAPGTLEALGARLLRGRALNDSIDRPGTPLTVVVNQAFVRRFFSPGEDPVGRLIEWGNMRVPIAGVMSDLRQNIAQPPLPEMDLPVAQIPAEYATDELRSMTLVVRSDRSASDLATQLREAMRQVDPGVPFRPMLSMDQVIAETLTFERLEGWMFGTFAVLALLLSLVGLYGMIHHEVELQTREIGVRMALGSSRGRVLGDVLRRVSLLLAAGIAAGWLATLALERSLRSLLEVRVGGSVALLLGVTLALAAAGLLACLPPARRAASVDPMRALRTE